MRKHLFAQINPSRHSGDQENALVARYKAASIIVASSKSKNRINRRFNYYFFEPPINSILQFIFEELEESVR